MICSCKFKKPDLNECKRAFNRIKSRLLWAKGVSSYADNHAFGELRRAERVFFESRKSNPALRYPGRKTRRREGFSVAGGKTQPLAFRTNEGGQWFVKIPNIGFVKMAEPLKSGIEHNAARIVRKGKKWFLTTTYEQEPRHKLLTGRCGIDLNQKQFVLYDGNRYRFFDLPRPLAHAQKRLKHLLRLRDGHKGKFKNKRKGSCAYRRLNQKIAATHERIASIRRDFFDKLTKWICSRYAEIVIEDLNVKAMMRGAKRIRRGMSDGCFGIFRGMLEYKTKIFGNRLVLADRFFASSKNCPCCGQRNAGHKAQKVFVCPSCGYTKHRDVVASFNLFGYPEFAERVASGQEVLKADAPDAHRPMAADGSPSVVFSRRSADVCRTRESQVTQQPYTPVMGEPLVGVDCCLSGYNTLGSSPRAHGVTVLAHRRRALGRTE